MENMKIGILVGSLRKESFSRSVAKTIMEIAPKSLTMEEIDISRLEMFNQDFDDEGKTPSSWVEFREQLKKYDGFLFITPEYNRSVPAVLKNALDVGSRPYGQSMWNGKPGAVVSVSPGSLGGFGANHHLRQTLMFLNIPTMQQPEAYIANVHTLIGGNGVLQDQSTREYLENFINSFAVWVETNSPAR